MIVIVDYGIGNTGSIRNMLKKVGCESVVTDSIGAIEEATGIVLPGVGAFDSVMTKLKESGLVSVLENAVLNHKTPFLGICVGMQVIFDGSDEGQLNGLGWIPGRVERFFSENSHVEDYGMLNVPHMGWNTLVSCKDSELLRDINVGDRFYFVHSFHAVCENHYVLAESNYGYTFPCIVKSDNIVGMQFHPEKSHRFGMQLLANFAEGLC